MFDYFLFWQQQPPFMIDIIKKIIKKKIFSLKNLNDRQSKSTQAPNYFKNDKNKMNNDYFVWMIVIVTI